MPPRPSPAAQANNWGAGAHQKAREGADEGKPQIAPVARLAIGAFGSIDPEDRQALVEAAEGGDEEAVEELRAEHVEAIEAMIEALEDEGSRKLIEIGMMLNGQLAGAEEHQSSSSLLLSGTKRGAQGGFSSDGIMAPSVGVDIMLNSKLDDLQVELEAQLEVGHFMEHNDTHIYSGSMRDQ